MDLLFFPKGLAIGFYIAAPVGPIGILCIRRTLKEGMQAGFVAGLGAATADAAYGCVAGFGLTAVSSFLVRWQTWLNLGGGIFLCYLGVRTFFSQPSERAISERGDTLPSIYGSTHFLTLSNPSTVLSFVAVFAGFGLGTSGDYRNAGALVLGVFIGSVAWWLLLSSSVALLRSRVTAAWMRAVNRISGCALTAFGLYALSRLLR